MNFVETCQACKTWLLNVLLYLGHIVCSRVNQLLIAWKLMLCKLHKTMVLCHLKCLVFTACVLSMWSFLLA